jgi:hypothetical protein
MFDEFTRDDDIKVLIAEIIDVTESLGVSTDEIGKPRFT